LQPCHFAQRQVPVHLGGFVKFRICIDTLMF
jgi:hypothetical protein